MKPLSQRDARIALVIALINSFTILVDEFLLGVKRCVNAEHPVVQEKRFRAMLFDKRDGFLCHSVFSRVTGLGIVAF